MHAAFPSSASNERFWVVDIGATSHMTSELSHLGSATPFSGTETITTAGDLGLQISNIGSSTLVAPTCSLQLHEVLHMLKVSQNLLSVHKLCQDNNCHFICDASGFWIQDKITGNILLKGLCSADLYPIPFIHPRSHLNFAFPFKIFLLSWTTD